jgi:OHCU decarboxylase
MRSNPVDYELVAPASLAGVLSLLAERPGEWLPIAGGTDVMVQYAAGKLGARKLVSLWNLPELRRIEVSADEVRIGAASTYSDLREHEVIAREFPLLASSASWTGGIANQNRGTLGGNIANASPAADSLPPLLAYEAELILISARGERQVGYTDFHTGYKTMLLAADELIRAVSLPRRFSEYISYSRKVGARNAQAISKVAIAGLGRMVAGRVGDVRIAAGSVAPVPVRLGETERFLQGKVIDPGVIQAARKLAADEIRPIDDIRSTAAYRLAVLANLIAEFLEKLSRNATAGVLARWNRFAPHEAADQVLSCCGSRAWAVQLAARRPLPTEAALLSASDEIWAQLQPSDWMEAFSKHPRIGERKAPPAASPRSASWSGQEQQQVAKATEPVQRELAAANREYEERFGRVFIVCATGKSAEQMLEILRGRLQNDDRTELAAAAEEQRKITHIRLKKWLNS